MDSTSFSIYTTFNITYLTVNGDTCVLPNMLYLKIRNRWYSSEMGRFISRDPIGYDAGDVNLYRFVGNSPVNELDPMGLAQVNFQGMIIRDLNAGGGILPFSEEQMTVYGKVQVGLTYPTKRISCECVDCNLSCRGQVSANIHLLDFNSYAWVDKMADNGFESVEIQIEKTIIHERSHQSYYKDFASQALDGLTKIELKYKGKCGDDAIKFAENKFNTNFVLTHEQSKKIDNYSAINGRYAGYGGKNNPILSGLEW